MNSAEGLARTQPHEEPVDIAAPIFVNSRGLAANSAGFEIKAHLDGELLEERET